MKCPKCGFEQPPSVECVHCGVIIERARPESEREEVIRRYVESTKAELAEDPLGRPIRPALKVIRTAAGIIGLLVGGWLFVVGQQIDLRPFHVLFLIGYGCVSLFWVFSSWLRVSVRQFAVEMLIFVVATLLLKIALPEAFHPGTLSNRESGPLFAGVPAMSPETFSRRAEGLASLARDVLDDIRDEDRLSSWLSSCSNLKRSFGEMKAQERKRVGDVYKKLVALEAKLKQVARKPDAEGFAQARSAVEGLEDALASIPN